MRIDRTEFEASWPRPRLRVQIVSGSRFAIDRVEDSFVRFNLLGKVEVNAEDAQIPEPCQSLGDSSLRRVVVIVVS